MKKVAILQSNYIPWKGYFDLISSVDEFIFYDEMQYTKHDWRNRNKIKASSGLLWLTVPVETKKHLSRKINEIKIVDKTWAKKHWKTIVQYYAKTPHFKEYKDVFEQLYEECESEELLCKINYKFIKNINKILEIETKISYSTDYMLIDGKTERVVDLCQQAHATEYISGPAAKDYLDEELFKKANIKLTWMDYTTYPEYHQLYPPFEHGVSIIDLIFNEGENAINYIKDSSSCVKL
jgi:hypothetical protein